jgi:hypothetical protein
LSDHVSPATEKPPAKRAARVLSGRLSGVTPRWPALTQPFCAGR